jgi:hypothetical protein
MDDDVRSYYHVNLYKYYADPFIANEAIVDAMQVLDYENKFCR